MAKQCKGLNSKCFLFTYLIIVGFLLVLWMNRLPLMHEDSREIPLDMQAYLESPPRSISSFSLLTNNKLTLTNDWFDGKWSWVYFGHGNCLPECQTSLERMNDLHAAFANNDFQFLVVGLDYEHESADDLADFLHSRQFDLTAATGSEVEIEQLARVFVALFLKTDFYDGSYQIEQEHHLFVVDPKGRVYATFRPPYTTASLTAQFLKLRYFYAQSE